MSTSQKEAIFAAVVSVLEANGVSFTEGETIAKEMLDKNMRSSVLDSLVQSFEAGNIAVDKAQENIRSYFSGTVSNWLRKDTRLNGGVKHTIKNPGSRRGQQDSVIKNLRLLQQRYTNGTDEYTAIQGKIDTRLGELKAKNQPKIDTSVIPDDLKHLVAESSATNTESEFAE